MMSLDDDVGKILKLMTKLTMRFRLHIASSMRVFSIKKSFSAKEEISFLSSISRIFYKS